MLVSDAPPKSGTLCKKRQNAGLIVTVNSCTLWVEEETQRSCVPDLACEQ